VRLQLRLDVVSLLKQRETRLLESGRSESARRTPQAGVVRMLQLMAPPASGVPTGARMMR